LFDNELRHDLRLYEMINTINCYLTAGTLAICFTRQRELSHRSAARHRLSSLSANQVPIGRAAVLIPFLNSLVHQSGFDLL
jgi:hypothetical protein